MNRAWKIGVVALALVCFTWSLAAEKKSEWTVEDVLLAESAGQFRISPDGQWAVWVKTRMDKDKGRRISNLFLSSLTEKKDSAAGVLESTGPRRFTLTMMREVTGDELGQAFMAGITANTDKAERSKFVNQLAQFGDAFVSIPQAKKGDTVTVDWVPDTGTVMYFNGKQQGEAMKDIGFYNAILKIWLGDKPVDSSLKPALLGKG